MNMGLTQECKVQRVSGAKDVQTQRSGSSLWGSCFLWTARFWCVDDEQRKYHVVTMIVAVQSSGGLNEL